jgi:peptide/nickel transport system permease protein
MSRFVVNRLVQSVIVLFGISILLFFLMHAIPGGPLALYIRQPGMTKARLAQIAADYGLNKPVWVQYIAWLGGAVRGDFGYSYLYGQPALQMMLQRWPATLTMVLPAFVISVTGAFILGIYSAVRQYSLGDYLVTIFSYGGLAMPVFWLALLAIILFAVQLHWLPTGGMVGTGPGAGTLADRLRHLAMPVLVLAFLLMAGESRYVRSTMLDVLNMDFIRTARAKGLGERVVMYRHALRNALLPVVTVMVLDAAFLLGGALVTETIFSWPGVARLFIQAITQTDYPVIMAIASFLSVIIVLANIVADVLYAVLDPRIRFS